MQVETKAAGEEGQVDAQGADEAQGKLEDLPHVDDCNYCQKCHVTTKPKVVRIGTSCLAVWLSGWLSGWPALQRCRATRHRQPGQQRPGRPPAAIARHRHRRPTAHPQPHPPNAPRPQPWSTRHIKSLEKDAKRVVLKSRSRLPNWMRHYKRYRLDNNPFVFMPVHQLHKEGKPNCTECVGCNTELSPLNVSQTFLGSEFYRPEVRGRRGAARRGRWKDAAPALGGPCQSGTFVCR